MRQQDELAKCETDLPKLAQTLTGKAPRLEKGAFQLLVQEVHASCSILLEKAKGLVGFWTMFSTVAYLSSEVYAAKLHESLALLYKLKAAVSDDNVFLIFDGWTVI